MNTKNVLVSFLTIVCALFLVASVSAQEYTITDVEVEGVDIFVNGQDQSDTAAITAGDTIRVEVQFEADFPDCEVEDGDFVDEFGDILDEDSDDFDDKCQDFDVTVEAEIDTGKRKVTEVSRPLFVQEGDSRKVVLNLKVPNELKDELGEFVDLEIEVDGEDFESETLEFELRVERTLYEADIKAISVSRTIEAGENFPVDIVVKNTGAGDLDDVFVTVSIVALGLEKSAFFGDLVAIEDDDDDDDDEEDTVSGRLFLKIPYDIAPGVYTLDVEVVNEDTVSTAVRQIVVENDFTSNVIATTLRKTAMAGEDASYNLLVVNPTSKLKVFRLIAESSGTLNTRASPAVVAVGPGSSETVTVTASSDTEGEHSFNVDVVSGESIVDTVTFNLDVEESEITNPVVVLTIILAIIFLVLLVVLIVLLSKKPEKSEEFGESYY